MKDRGFRSANMRRRLVLGGISIAACLVLAADPVHGQHRGIFWVEMGVAVTVSGVMLKIFYMFAGRRREDPDQ